MKYKINIITNSRPITFTCKLIPVSSLLFSLKLEMVVLWLPSSNTRFLLVTEHIF